MKAKKIGELTKSWLGVGSHLLHVGLLFHHLSEVDIATDGVLVAVLSGVDTRGIGGVALEGLEGIEVLGRARGIGIERGIDILLGGVVPELIVVLAVVEGAISGGGGGRSRSSRCGGGGNGGGSSGSRGGSGRSISSTRHGSAGLAAGAAGGGLDIQKEIYTNRR